MRHLKILIALNEVLMLKVCTSPGHGLRFTAWFSLLFSSFVTVHAGKRNQLHSVAQDGSKPELQPVIQLITLHSSCLWQSLLQIACNSEARPAKEMVRTSFDVMTRPCGDHRHLGTNGCQKGNQN